MKLLAAALKLNVSDRTLHDYENDKIKNKCPHVIMGAMELYDDENIGVAFLNENPVFRTLFNGDTLLSKLVERLKSAMSSTLDAFLNSNRPDGFAY